MLRPDVLRYAALELQTAFYCSELHMMFWSQARRAAVARYIACCYSPSAGSLFDEGCLFSCVVYTPCYDIYDARQGCLSYHLHLPCATTPPVQQPGTSSGLILGRLLEHTVSRDYPAMTDNPATRPTIATADFCVPWQCNGQVNREPASATARHVSDCVALVAATTLFSTARCPHYSPPPCLHPSLRARVHPVSAPQRTSPTTRPCR